MRDRFGSFLIVSILIHAAAISAFFRPVFHELVAPLRNRQNTFVRGRILSPYDSLFALTDSFSQAQSGEEPYAPDSGDARIPLNLLLYPLRPPVNVIHGLEGWKGAVPGSAVEPSRLDSLLAYAERMRSAMSGFIFSRDFGRQFDSHKTDIDWKSMLNSMLEEIERRAAASRPFQPGAESGKDVWREFWSSMEWRKILQKALAYSMRQTAMEKLRNEIECAVAEAMKRCGRWKGRGGVQIGGEGGRSLVFGRFPGKDGSARFGSAFERALGSALGSRREYWGYLSSMFDGNELAESLEAHAKRSLTVQLGGDSTAQAWSEAVDFGGVIGAMNNQRANGGQMAYQIKEMSEYLKHALGAGSATWFSDDPSPGRLSRDPNFFHEHARSFWSFVLQAEAAPNLLVPDMDRYARAALRVRNRKLKTLKELDLEEGWSSIPAFVEFPIPELSHIHVLEPRARLSRKQGRVLLPAEFPTQKWGAAIRAENGVRIDGELSEWQNAAAFRLHATPQGLSSVPHALRGFNHLMAKWDNRGLYFAYSIPDGQDNQTPLHIFSHADALEMFFDPHNRKDTVRVAGRSYQYWIWPRKARGPTVGRSVFSSPHTYQPRLLEPGLIRFASKRREQHYTCEVFVPAGMLHAWHPLPGKIMGFNFSINNGEGIFLRWVTNQGRNVSHHPNLWGDLLLMGTNAKMEILPDSLLLPGEDLSIKVTDLDMDLRPEREDHLWVTVSSEFTKDRIPVQLTETHETSGVFTGKTATVFFPQAKYRERLSVMPGDELTVYYLDQYCLGGHKRVPRVGKTHVGRGVYRFAGLGRQEG